MRRIMAGVAMAAEATGSVASSLDRRRHRPGQPSDLSTTHPRGRSTKPIEPAAQRTTTSARPNRKQASRAARRVWTLSANAARSHRGFVAKVAAAAIQAPVMHPCDNLIPGEYMLRVKRKP